MNTTDLLTDHEWLLQQIELEAERGEIVPGGAVGGVVARRTKHGKRGAASSAALRARHAVRFLALAISTQDEQAA